MKPINNIWAHYVITKNEAASKKIWNEHLQSAKYIAFSVIAEKISETNDEQLAKTLVEYMKSNQAVSKESIGAAYKILLVTHVNNNNLSDGLAVVEELAAGIGIKLVGKSALNLLKNALEENGTECPYEIPAELE